MVDDRYYNLITTLTNVTCIFPIYRSFIRRDWITFGVIGFVSVVSAISHLVENHKHGMIGFFPVDPYTSWIFNQIDVLGSILVIGRLIWLFYKKYRTNSAPITSRPKEWLLMLLPIIFLRISEYDKYNRELRSMYLLTRSIWHLSVYPSIDHFLRYFIYV